jgi:hypothetical protein
MQTNLSNEQYALIKTKTIQSMIITRVLKLLLVRYVDFEEQSTLIPFLKLTKLYCTRHLNHTQWMSFASYTVSVKHG